MSKEELLAQGWDLVFSGPCEVVAWGKWFVHLRHAVRGMVSGYGSDEQAALNDAATTIQKPLEGMHEIRH